MGCEISCKYLLWSVVLVILLARSSPVSMKQILSSTNARAFPQQPSWTNENMVNSRSFCKIAIVKNSKDCKQNIDCVLSLQRKQQIYIVFFFDNSIMFLFRDVSGEKPIFKQFVCLIRHDAIRGYSRRNMSNHMLTLHKK